MRTNPQVVLVSVFFGIAATGWALGCGSSGRDPSFFGSGAGGGSAAQGAGSGGGSGAGGAGAPTPKGASGGGSIVIGSGNGATAGDGGPEVVRCTSAGLCANTHCANGGHTTISGVVYDPAGQNPLYDVAVYVPQSPPSALPTGASCYTCASLYTGNVVAGTLTDSAGHFQIVDAPTGKAVPLVVQVGKWRRQFTVDTTDCADTMEPMLTLPSNATEGDLPNIAVSTGGSDSLECLLKRIGIDSGGDGGTTGEWVSGAGGTGHVHIFQGGGGRGGGGTTAGPAMAGGSPASQTALWTSGPAMQPYDIVILSCEGGEDPNANPQALNDYATLGGRVFASHFHYSWFNQAPFLAYNLATWHKGMNDMGDINALVQTTLPNGMPFPKGVAMEQWLGNVGALSNATPPELPIQQARHNADVAVANTPSTPWIVADMAATPPGATEYFSWDMPVVNPGAVPCGRIVYSDLHVGAASGDYGQVAGAAMGGGGFGANAITPSGCADNPLSPQEKALEFMLFDLSACLTPVNETPKAPSAQ